MISENTSSINETPSYSFLAKILRFVAAAGLADWVLGNAILIFIQNLHSKGLLQTSSDFQANHLIWGESIWLNLLHVAILAFTAGLFGFIFGYLSRRLSRKEKIVYTTIYVFFKFIILAVFSVLINYFAPSFAIQWNQIFNDAFNSISSSTFDTFILLAGQVAMFVSALYFINKGCTLGADQSNLIDKEKPGTLLNVKWFHYFWLFIPFGIYSQIVLNLFFEIGNTIAIWIQNFEWISLIGGTTGENNNSQEIAWGKITILVIIAFAVTYLMALLISILSVTSNQNWIIKLLISLVIGFIIPFLVVYHTSLAG
jgi:hypothetical protein